MKKKGFGRPAALALLLCFPGLGFANEEAVSPEQLVEVGFVEDTGAAERIEAGDRLRVLSQAVPAAVCHLHNGIATDTASEQLAKGLAEFELLSAALLDGNEALGIIGSEDRRRTRVMIEELRQAWQPMHDAANAVLADSADAAAVATAYGLASAMLDQSYEVLSTIEGQYSNPTEILASDTMLLEIAGRQSMMTQRLAFLSCRMWSGAADDTYKDLLNQASSRFELAFGAMIHGAPELGISAPPTAEIAAALDAISADCGLVIAKLNSLVETGQKDAEAAAELYRLLTEKTDAMDEIAHMYAAYSKRIY